MINGAQRWRKQLRSQPEHISTYCLTYEEDTEFFLRHARGEFRQDADADAEFFEMTMAILEDAGYRALRNLELRASWF